MRKGPALRIALAGIFVLIVALALHIGVLFRQLNQAFVDPEQFIPTRIFSDVTRISPPETRESVRARLKRLGYALTETAEETRFTLRQPTYPDYLVPENHPVLTAGGKPVLLRFDSNKKGALLESIQIEDEELADLYLEPELISTLSRGGAQEGKKEIRDFVPFAEIPAPVWKAIIAIEDQHFLEHSGFDPRGLARAIWVNLRTLSLAQGGSTLTQQLVKNLMARRGKNLFRKAEEFFLSILIETKYEKERILERYLNEVYLGQVGNLEVHGVSEGAKHFFGKRLHDLNLGEVALMAGLIRGPGFYSPYRYETRAKERKNLVLRKMAETGQIAEEEARLAMREPIRLAPPISQASRAPYFTDFVKAELIRHLKDRMTELEIVSAGFRVYTTLDPAMNMAAQDAVSQGIDEIEKRLGLTSNSRLEGALAAVDPSTGHIRALVGGRNYARSTFNRILNMKRQVGSTFKPLVYLAAFEQGQDASGVPYSPGYPMEDAPWKLTYDQGRQTWEPRNYEEGYLGWIPLRTALALSINTVAAKLGVAVGLDKVVQTARSLGIDSELPEVPSLSLGVAELSPIELLRVYATIANHGNRDELTVIRGITQDNGAQFARFIYSPKKTVSEGGADLITDALQNVFTEGTARDAVKMGFDRPAAGKTGTTSDHRDAWFAGYTPQLTAVVWVGQDQDPTPEPSSKPATKNTKNRGRLTGANSALPIWARFMNQALRGEPPAVFPISGHTTSIKLDRYTGRRAARSCPDTQVVVTQLVSGREPSTESCESGWPPSIRETRAR